MRTDAVKAPAWSEARGVWQWRTALWGEWILVCANVFGRKSWKAALDEMMRMVSLNGISNDTFKIEEKSKQATCFITFCWGAEELSDLCC